MSDQPSIHNFPSPHRLVTRLRHDFHSGGHDFVPFYAYNGIGTTRVSMAFKDVDAAPAAALPVVPEVQATA